MISRAVANHVQGKITIGRPGDRYEQEADRVADQVMAMHDSAVQRQPMEEEEELVQPKTLTDSHENIQLQSEEEEEEPIQTRQDSPSRNDTTPVPWLVSRLKSGHGGSSLPASSRSFMEKRFGRDFSGVKVHDGPEAIRMSSALNAQAFTHGKNIYFNRGRFQPGTSDGRKLLAHELAHVVQQTGKLQRKTVVHNAQGTEKDQVEKAFSAAKRMANNAQKYMGGKHKTRYKKWYDRKYKYKDGASRARFSKVKHGWVKVYDVFKSKDVEFECNTRNDPYFAMVYLKDKKYYVELRKDFWAASLTGRDSRGGTIVHEISHEEMYTDDHKYGEAKAKKLAREKPSDAIDNADNWEYFAEDSY